ncbi:MAG: double-strand break repair protein AddB [Rhizomicrobium sp.]|jgi:ATP-dependent helicase/nuclease subunit B
MAVNVFTIPAGAAFAELLVRGVLQQSDTRDPFALADTTILVPTRRAVRTLSDSFARNLGGSALLPQIRPLGDVEEDELLFDLTTEDFSLPPVVDLVRRRLLLASLVDRWDRARHDGESTFGFAQAASLARGLGQFIDEAETQGADLAKLEELAGSAFAEHWQHVRDFLVFMRDEWPKVMAAEGVINPAARRNLALAALATRFRNSPPKAPVIAAGTTGSIPATAMLLRTVATLPLGAVVLPGLDRDLDDDSWARLDEGHAQFGMKQLLARMEIDRHDVRDWSAAHENTQRALLLRETLRPAPTTDAWRALAAGGRDAIGAGLDGLSLIEAGHPAEEAATIALILRHALEKSGQTAALVTPDRTLARRVAAELGRWDIAIDDSAGRPLANTPPGAFLSLVADAATSNFAPVALLALLKHPLASAGQEPHEFRHRVRELDRYALRGPRPDPGLCGIAKAIQGARAQSKSDAHKALLASLLHWWGGVAALLEPFAHAMMRPRIRLGELVRLHAQTAEHLAATRTDKGYSRLWAGQAGESARELVTAFERADSDLPVIEPAAYPVLLRMLAEERAVRPAYGTHPRLAILGPLEARLQHFDVAVLGGMNEGTWPHPAPADPWLSRPMRKTLGLESPERRIGLAAHDFATLASGPRVYFTRSLKSEGTPTVASRWVERLRQLTKGLGLQDRLACSESYTAYASAMSVPDGAPAAEARPNPAPALPLRPRSLSVTEIETWLRDPYAIYAKHILRLRPLDPLDAQIGPLERGTAIHLVLERFLRLCETGIPADALNVLLAEGDAVFAEMGIPRASLALWKPRLARASEWFVGIERQRRARIDRSFLEVSGERIFTSKGGDFRLRGRADRIDVLRNGSAVIIDYKSGNPPTNKQVEILLAPQLPLEAAMLAAGGFADIGERTTSELVYIRFSGGQIPGEYKPIKGNVGDLVSRSVELLVGRIALFDDETTAYTSRVIPFSSDIGGDYDHLARVREWSASGWKDESE